MRALFLSILMVLSLGLRAETFNEVISMDERPDGVVFEILAPNERSWTRTQPKLLQAIEQLKRRWPDIDIAVVSHGNEQFALTTEKASVYPDLHQSVLNLGEQGVDVHVCGTYASWRDIKPEAFPDYVDVSASGPAQINDYKALGYVLVTDFAF